MQVLQYLDYCSFVVNFPARTIMSSNFVVLLQNCLTILDPLQFHTNFMITLSVLQKSTLDVARTGIKFVN